MTKLERPRLATCRKISRSFQSKAGLLLSICSSHTAVRWLGADGPGGTLPAVTPCSGVPPRDPGQADRNLPLASQAERTGAHFPVRPSLSPGRSVSGKVSQLCCFFLRTNCLNLFWFVVLLISAQSLPAFFKF